LFILRHLQKSSLHPLTNIKQGDYGSTDMHVGCLSRLTQNQSRMEFVQRVTNRPINTVFRYYLQQTNDLIIL
jgi:hypothetical protein